MTRRRGPWWFAGLLLGLACSASGTQSPSPDRPGIAGVGGAGGSSGRGSTGGTGAESTADAGATTGSDGPRDGSGAFDADPDLVASLDATDAPAIVDDAGGGPTAPVVVAAFAGAQVSFTPTENHRRVEADVDFPGQGPAAWKNISLRLRLSCPANRCDFWDRWAYLGIVDGSGDDAPVTELARFVTPYRVGADWTEDLSALAPLLQGHKRLAMFIDTWVGPGNAQGNGWLVDATFTFTPGTLARVPVQVIPLWPVTSAEAGDPAKPMSAAFPPRAGMIPADASAVELRSFITGHGQGNLQNCAEFCPKSHTFTIGGMGFSQRIWREDCATSTVRGQQGTFQYSRAGWCPGALVNPWTVDVSAATLGRGSVTVSYAPEAWVNSCRPTATPCTACAAGVCAYNDGSHTAPAYVQSAVLVVYKKP